MIGLYLCRQLPTLPHTFACSTIGPAGLNFRVRDGNGWNPRGKITDKSRRLAGVNEPPQGGRLGACCRDPERLSARDLYAISVSLSRRTFKEREDEASQLNRLGETGLAPSLQGRFRRRQSSVLVVSPSIQFLMRTDDAIGFRTSSN